MPRPLQILSDPEPVPYRTALAGQEAWVAGMLRDAARPQLIRFLEHPPVYTCGRTFEPGHLLRDERFLAGRGAELVTIGRGGSVTFHGPGQLVVYLHLDLKELDLGLAPLFRELEDWVIRFFAGEGIEAFRREGKTGVWLASGKVCAMGLGARGFISLHGLALNLAVESSWYEWIVPCGLAGEPVTSLAAQAGTCPAREQVERKLLACLPERLAGLPRA